VKRLRCNLLITVRSHKTLGSGNIRFAGSSAASVACICVSNIMTAIQTPSVSMLRCTQPSQAHTRVPRRLVRPDCQWHWQPVSEAALAVRYCRLSASMRRRPTRSPSWKARKTPRQWARPPRAAAGSGSRPSSCQWVLTSARA